MIIGVDAGALSIVDDRLKVGVYRVTKNALAALAASDKRINYRLYSFGAIEEGILKAFEGRAEIVHLPKLGWQRVWLPLELKFHPVDAFLGFSQSLPSVHTLCDIGFIYDLGFLHEPEVYGSAAATLQNQTEALMTRADHIITISEVTKADILLRYTNKDAGSRIKSGMTSITVAYPGVDTAFSPAGEKYVGPNPYFLFVGSLNKAKDLPTLIEIYAEFLEKKKMDSGSKAGMTKHVYDLYLIGGDYWPDPAIDEAIEKYHLGDRVKKLGFVSDDALPNYYRGAIAFVTTALREGFCLPAVEAMACGTPVVALDRGALKEVVGEGGIIVQETENRKQKTETFVAAMVKMMDRTLREKYAMKAITQAKKYRWDKFGSEILSHVAIYSRPPLALRQA
ncbi:MAG: glycosyltransferase family 1 protein [Candidatus Gottesmanbacteria bacterium]|nr:glycosyltransferase family 1 protein [Candidatus Gottesmanbacteria bacterium]